MIHPGASRRRDPGRPAILIVSHDVDVLTILRSALGCVGHSVSTTSSAKGARQLYRRRPPDLLILDMGTPAVESFDLLWHVYEDDAEANVIAIASDEEVLIDARNVGAAVTLVKPLHLPTVLRAIDWLCESAIGSVA